jgi:5'-3' exonuclease
MGIKNLNKFLINQYPELIKNKKLEDYSGKKIAIDISTLLYRKIINFRNTGKDMLNSNNMVTSHILGLFNDTVKLLSNNIIPIYVFDENQMILKNKTLENRKK